MVAQAQNHSESMWTMPCPAMPRSPRVMRSTCSRPIRDANRIADANRCSMTRSENRKQWRVAACRPPCVECFGPSSSGLIRPVATPATSCGPVREESPRGAPILHGLFRTWCPDDSRRIAITLARPSDNRLFARVDDSWWGELRLSRRKRREEPAHIVHFACIY